MDEANRKKLERIYDFIIETSKGNFSLQLDSKNSGELEPLMLLLNMMSEELNILIHHLYGSKSTPKPVSIIIIFDHDLTIKFVSDSIRNLLSLDVPSATEKFSLRDLIDNKSLKRISKFIQRSRRKRIAIDFIHASGLHVETSATIEQIPETITTNLYLLTANKIIYQNKRLDKLLKSQHKTSYPTKNRSLLLQENREMIERIEEYVIKHLDEPFPGLAELASFSNASESKIKKGFKLHYGMTIYQYYTKKRHEKALLLLTQTEKQVSTVAMECGFINAAHFSRSFKKYFGISPSQVQRRPDNI